MSDHFKEGFMKCATEDESTALQRILLAGRSGIAPGALGGGLVGFVNKGSFGEGFRGAIAGAGLGSLLGLGIGAAKLIGKSIRDEKEKKLKEEAETEKQLGLSPGAISAFRDLVKKQMPKKN